MKFLRAFAILIIFNMPLHAQGGQTRYADLSFGALFAAGGASVSGEDLLFLQAGAHDPNVFGFTLQNLEMSFLGAIDPFFNGEIHLIFQIDEEGESLIEVEEAFLTSRNFPMGLQLRAGTYFTEFGRLNLQHPHSWSYTDQPLVNAQFLGGDGLRGPGARLSWLAPLPWYSEVIVGLQNAIGETAVSFLGEPGETDFAGYPLVDRDREGLGDLLRTVRLLNSFLVGDETAVNAGLSGLWGPNRMGLAGSTRIIGFDLYIKWQRAANDNGWPFITLQNEIMRRKFSPDAQGESVELQQLAETLSKPEYGYYWQLQWGYLRGWVAGLRNGSVYDETSPISDYRNRWAGNLTYYPSEFSKIRLQINLDDGSFLNKDAIWAVWLQYEFLMGQHGGHKF